MAQEIAKEDRKITSDKFTITIPKDWRDSHHLTPKMALTPFYREGSPLVLIPNDVVLDTLEVQLITLLVNYKNIKDSQKIAQDLGDIVNAINEGVFVAG